MSLTTTSRLPGFAICGRPICNHPPPHPDAGSPPALPGGGGPPSSLLNKNLYPQISDAVICRVAGCSAAVARLFWEQEVGGSIPPTPTIVSLLAVNLWRTTS